MSPQPLRYSRARRVSDGSRKIAEGEGAGEIVITSIDRDGTLEGYDLELIAKIGETVVYL